MSYIDRKFIGIISPRLAKFQQKESNLYNFRCPYCGDSKKNPNRARGFIYGKQNQFFYICHNCGKSTTLGKLIQHLDTSTYDEYVMEKFQDERQIRHEPSMMQPRDIPKPVVKNGLDRFSGHSVAHLDETHAAKVYLRQRMIPEDRLADIYCTANFKEFLDSNFTYHSKKNDENSRVPEDSRIVTFFTNRNGTITHVSGRALDKDAKLRYMTVRTVEVEETKMFGYNRVDPSSQIYVFEGQFDSMFVKNGVASGDSALYRIADLLGKNSCVLVYDAQPRNREIVKQINIVINKGYKVCLLPEMTEGKDINEMVMQGLVAASEVKQLIDKNSFQGLDAELHFQRWKKV